MLIRFTQDYRGVLTDEQFYTFGTEVDLPNGSDLVSAGRAEKVVVAPTPQDEPLVSEPIVPKQKGKKK